MRALLTLIAIIYVVGIGFDISPKIQAKWYNATLITLVDLALRDLPHAAAWPVRAFQSMINRP
jgi:hypothetical protein